YITGLAMGELAGFISTEIETHYTHGITALLVWFMVPLCIELISLKSLTLRSWFEGRGTVFVKDGKVQEKNLKKERYTANELMEQLRSKNVFNLADVEFAMLEASGELSVLLKRENQPLTPKHLGVQTSPVKESQTVIIDGNVMSEALADAGFNRAWLITELEKIGVTQDNVFIGQVDSYGTLYVDLYDDMKKLPVNNERLLTLAALKKCEADMTLFGLATQNESARAMYKECVRKLGEQIEKLTPMLKR
ncbi:MAG: rane protein, partial [Paenibacillus sp.]|nr:rane protein [Paenibacillus sp.]